MPVALAGKPQSFTAVLTKIGGKLYLPLPFDPDAVWGKKPKHHVNGALGEQPFRGAVETFDGVPGVAIGPALRRDRGYREGQGLQVRLDAEGPQREALAPDLAAALAADPASAAFFDGLAQFYRKAYLTWIDATKKSPQLRAERIAQVVAWLAEGRKQRP